MQAIRASVLLLTYNQEQFVAEALQSLLDQDHDNLEIVVSDDCSRDSTWQQVLAVCQTYAGSKKIKLNRNDTNLGIGANYNKAFSLSSGDVLFSAAGDDVSLPQRCSQSLALWNERGQVPDLIATDAFDMTLDGRVCGTKIIDNLDDWGVSEWFLRRPYHFGASHMLTRRMVSIRPLDTRLNAEDQCLMFRALMMGGAVRLKVPLVKHRQNGVSSKAKPLSYSLKKAKLHKDASSALIETAQMRADALALGHAEHVCVSLNRMDALNQYVITVLQASHWGVRFKLLVTSSGVTWSKRIRFFVYAAFPWLFVPGMWLKSKLQGATA